METNEYFTTDLDRMSGLLRWELKQNHITYADLMAVEWDRVRHKLNVDSWHELVHDHLFDNVEKNFCTLKINEFMVNGIHSRILGKKLFE